MRDRHLLDSLPRRSNHDFALTHLDLLVSVPMTSFAIEEWRDNLRDETKPKSFELRDERGFLQGFGRRVEWDQ